MKGLIALGNHNGKIAVLISTNGKVIINAEDRLVVHPSSKHQKRIKKLSRGEVMKLVSVFFQYVESCQNPSEGAFFVEAADDKELALMAALALDMATDSKTSIKKVEEPFWSDLRTKSGLALA